MHVKGLIAGVNASLKSRGDERDFVLSRTEGFK